MWFYLSKAFAPIHLTLIYPQWRVDTGNLLWWLPLLTAAVVTIALWRQRNNPQTVWGRSVLVAWLFFCVALVPVLGFTDAGFMQYSLVANHYQHIALIGVVTLVAAGWGTWQEQAHGKRQTANICATVAIGALAILASHQASIFKNPITLYQDTLDKNPSCTLAHFNLANTFAATGRLEEAVEQYRQALRIEPDYVEAHNNLGSTLVRQGQINEAIDQYRKALEIEPNNGFTYTNMGIALLNAERTPEAIECLEKAVRLADNYGDAHYNLGVALAKSGRLPEAAEQFKQSVKLPGDELKLYAKITAAYVQLRRPAEAIAAAQRGIELARSQGKTELAEQIETWLNSYRAQQNNVGDAAPPAPPIPQHSEGPRPKNE